MPASIDRRVVLRCDRQRMSSRYCYSEFALEAAIACSTFSLRPARLKLAPACIGGYSTNDGTYLAITCAGIWKRHISCLKTSQ